MYLRIINEALLLERRGKWSKTHRAENRRIKREEDAENAAQERYESFAAVKGDKNYHRAQAKRARNNLFKRYNITNNTYYDRGGNLRSYDDDIYYPDRGNNLLDVNDTDDERLKSLKRGASNLRSVRSWKIYNKQNGITPKTINSYPTTDDEVYDLMRHDPYNYDKLLVKMNLDSLKDSESNGFKKMNQTANQYINK